MLRAWSSFLKNEPRHDLDIVHLISYHVLIPKNKISVYSLLKIETNNQRAI